jgi:two-component sensor histidine kinase
MGWSLTSLLRTPLSRSARYGATIAMMLLGALCEAAVYAMTGAGAFYLLLPGIVYSGILFDRGSAYLATALGTLVAATILALQFPDRRGIILVVLFFVTALATSHLGEKLREVIDRLTQMERIKDTLLKELDHRTKNNMMGMASLLRLQARQVTHPEVKGALEAAASRVGVMADLYDQLQPSSGERLVNMRHYLGRLGKQIEDLRGDRPLRIDVIADDTVLPEHKALPLAIVINELITNSMKHAFPGGRAGVIAVALRTESGEVIASVRDDGIGCASDAHIGLGSRLVRVMVEQLQGRFLRENAAPGCVTTIWIPA